MAKRKGSVAPSTRPGSKATRRRFLGAATAGGVAAWSGLTIFSREAHAAGRMRVLCWPGYEEKPVVEEFEQKNDCKVEFKTYIGGEQMLQFFAPVAQGHVRRHHQRCRICAEADGAEGARPAEGHRLSRSRRLPPEVSRLPAAARAGRQDLGCADTLQLLWPVLQHQVHERGRGQDLEFAVPAQVQGQGRAVRLVPAEHEQCQPGGESRTTRRPTIFPTPSSPR